MAYINGLGNISPQLTYDNQRFLDEILEYNTTMLKCVEPDYQAFIEPRNFRRMSRLMKLAWLAVNICIDDAGIKTLDAIITGTGMGCYENTEKFLFSIYDYKEMFIPPTPFIQSTHNTIGSQIALMLQCQNYNMTYAHRGFSFETSLLDAMMLFQEDQYTHILVGGFDEMTDNEFRIFDRLQYWKRSTVKNLDLLKDITTGTIAGEGNAFFLLQNTLSKNTYAQLRSIRTFFKPTNIQSIIGEIKSFLSQQKITLNEIDLVLLGLNGDPQFDDIYHKTIDYLLPDISKCYYKHLCGEYHTSTAFALWLAAKIIRHQQVPEVIRSNNVTAVTIKNILIYNHYRNVNHSLILLSQ